MKLLTLSINKNIELSIIAQVFLQNKETLFLGQLNGITFTKSKNYSTIRDRIVKAFLINDKNTNKNLS